MFVGVRRKKTMKKKNANDSSRRAPCLTLPQHLPAVCIFDLNNLLFCRGTPLTLFFPSFMFFLLSLLSF